MNFVDPKEIDIPRHGTKNRYKTILPSKFLCFTAHISPLTHHFQSAQHPHVHLNSNYKRVSRQITTEINCG